MCGIGFKLAEKRQRKPNEDCDRGYCQDDATKHHAVQNVVGDMANEMTRTVTAFQSIVEAFAQPERCPQYHESAKIRVQ